MSRPEGVKRSSCEELMKTYQQKTLNVVLTGARTRTMEWLNLIKSLQTQEVLDSMRLLPDEITTHKDLKCTRSDGGNWRIIMPEPLRLQCLQRMHDFAHPGERGTIKLVAVEYYWPKLSEDCIHYVKACRVCQRNKVKPKLRRDYLHFSNYKEI